MAWPKLSLIWFEVIQVDIQQRKGGVAALAAQQQRSKLFPRAWRDWPSPVRGSVLACWASLPPLWRREFRRAPRGAPESFGSQFRALAVLSSAPSWICLTVMTGGAGRH